MGDEQVRVGTVSPDDYEHSTEPIPDGSLDRFIFRRREKWVDMLSQLPEGTRVDIEFDGAGCTTQANIIGFANEHPSHDLKLVYKAGGALQVAPVGSVLRVTTRQIKLTSMECHVP